MLEDHPYDVDGNRLGGGAAYDDQDRLTTRGGVGYTWDADGFLKTRGADTFAYSPQRRAAAARRGDHTYAYDALGRRVARAGATKTTSTATRPTRSR